MEATIEKIIEYVQNHCQTPYEKMSIEDKIDFDISVDRFKKFAEYLNQPLMLLEQKNDITVVGNCANCGVEFHIHQ